jgi:hypothetical protein
MTPMATQALEYVPAGTFHTSTPPGIVQGRRTALSIDRSRPNRRARGNKNRYRDLPTGPKDRDTGLPLLSWENRSREKTAIETKVAGTDGRPREVDAIRQGGRPRIAPFFDPNLEYTCPGPEPDAESVRQWLAGRVLEKIADYIASGKLTEKELFAIRCLWLQGLSLRRVAQLEGTSPQAIRERVEGSSRGYGGLAKKAPEFYKWWAFKNRTRRRKVKRTSP